MDLVGLQMVTIRGAQGCVISYEIMQSIPSFGAKAPLCYSPVENLLKLCYPADWFYLSHLPISSLIKDHDCLPPSLSKSVS